MSKAGSRRDSESRKLKLSVKVASSSINFWQKSRSELHLEIIWSFGAKMKIKLVSAAAAAALTSRKKLFQIQLKFVAFPH